mgnify:CR=1 FL=1
MNIDKFKQQHLAILASIDALRQLARGGVAAQAQAIAEAAVQSLQHGQFVAVDDCR